MRQSFRLIDFPQVSNSIPLRTELLPGTTRTPCDRLELAQVRYLQSPTHLSNSFVFTFLSKRHRTCALGGQTGDLVCSSTGVDPGAKRSSRSVPDEHTNGRRWIIQGLEVVGKGAQSRRGMPAFNAEQVDVISTISPSPSVREAKHVRSYVRPLRNHHGRIKHSIGGRHFRYSFLA